MPLQTFKSYKNDLFGDEDGDVLASEAIPAAKPIEAALPRPTTPSNRVQLQIALNQQKRLARLQVRSSLDCCPCSLEVLAWSSQRGCIGTFLLTERIKSVVHCMLLCKAAACICCLSARTALLQASK